MEAAQSIDEQVKSFVAESRCKETNEIRGDITLLGDLGLDGDDAFEFLSDFAKRFNVDMKGFRFEDHFGHEGMYPWQFPVFFWRLISAIWDKRKPEEVAGLKAIKVEDLIQAASARRWSESSPLQFR